MPQGQLATRGEQNLEKEPRNQQSSGQVQTSHIKASGLFKSWHIVKPCSALPPPQLLEHCP